MAFNLVIEKHNRRIIFARDAALPLMVDALFSHVSHSYSIWPGAVPENFTVGTCWQYRLVNNSVVYEPIDAQYEPYYIAAAQKGAALQHLRRAVDKHRDFVTKQVIGQDQVYLDKSNQADHLLRTSGEINVDLFPYVRDYAVLQGINIRDAAALIRFRYGQQQQILIQSENERMTFTKRILESTSENIDMITREVLEYEQRA